MATHQKEGRCVRPYLYVYFKIICLITVWLAALVAFGIFTGNIK